jgi:hypothetical protein
LGEPLGDLEAVDVREPDVEQDELRPQPPDTRDGRLAVGGLPNHLHSIRLEQCPRGPPEVLVIVDDQDRPQHTKIVARPTARRIRASPKLARQPRA